MAYNYMYAWSRFRRQQSGETVHDPQEQYETLKRMEPQVDAMYAAGQIRAQKYESYKQSLHRWEEMIQQDGE